MADQTLAKYVNELGILTLLRTQGGLSRAEISRRVGLTPATITRLISNLEIRGLVHEVRQGKSTGTRDVGRPGMAIEIKADGAYFLGIEIGVGILRFALIDLAATPISSSEVFVSKTLRPDEAVKAIGDYIETLSRDTRFKDRIIGVGVTVPGLVTNDGFVINLPILGWTDVDLAGLLRDVASIPCSIENNANAAAFGSVYTQPSLPRIATIFLKLGTGVGGAAIINGRLLRGASGNAGEFGHIRMTEHGHKCSCGQVGCLESWINLGALARKYLGTDDLPEERLFALPMEVARKAKDGDPEALAAQQEIAHWLSLGLVSLVNIFNPTTIMLGGIMVPLVENCLEAIQSKVRGSMIPGITMPDLRISHLGRYECAVGAATIAHHNAFDISRVDVTESDLHP
jgi:predicted NBD/HSP70 family sugar kinase